LRFFFIEKKNYNVDLFRSLKGKDKGTDGNLQVPKNNPRKEKNQNLDGIINQLFSTEDMTEIKSMLR